MHDPSSTPEPGQKTARAPLGGIPVASRRCPAEGCGRVLTDRQRACSARCRASLSRQRQAAAQRRRDARLATLLHEAIALLEEPS